MGASPVKCTAVQEPTGHVQACATHQKMPSIAFVMVRGGIIDELVFARARRNCLTLLLL